MRKTKQKCNNSRYKISHGTTTPRTKTQYKSLITITPSELHALGVFFFWAGAGQKVWADQRETDARECSAQQTPFFDSISLYPPYPLRSPRGDVRHQKSWYIHNISRNRKFKGCAENALVFVRYLCVIRCKNTPNITFYRFSRLNAKVCETA